MTWAAAVPAALVTAVWCVLPGMLVARAAGWRGIACWGSAPLISIALIATTAIGAGRIGVPWGPWPVVVTSVAVAAAVLAVRAAARISARRRSASPESVDASPPAAGTGSRWAFLHRSGPDGGHAGLALAVGMGVTIAISWLTVVLAFGPVDAISPTYDAVHHYNAVARILDSGDGSSLTVGELTTPGQPSVYPAAWHDLVALVVLTSAAAIPVASNLVALAVAALVWPLSCVLLLRQLVGRRPGAFLAGPILATAFTAMPWMVMTWGVLWPNLLGLALVPAGLAAAVTVIGLTRDSTIGRPAATVLGVVAAPAIALAHPNAVTSLLVIGLSPVVCAAVVSAVRLFRERRPLRAAAALIAAGAVAMAVLWFLAWSPFLAGVRSFDWPATMGAREAVLGVLWNAMNQRPELFIVSVLVIVGAVFALRSPLTGWLVPAHATTGFLYVLAVSREGALTTALTGAWYNDSYRIAAMLPITGVPLATIGVLGIAGLLVRAALRLRRVDPTAERRRMLALPVTAAVIAALVLASDGFRIGVHAYTVAGTYQREATWMLQPGQREFLDAAGQLVPPDGLVAANPWTGNALLYALTGREVMFPHMSGRWTPDQQVVKEHLRDAGEDRSVCEAVRSTGLTHVIDGPVSYWPWDERAHAFPGLTELGQTPGFEPVASGGGSTLYRVTACDPGPPPG
ncbi:MULTISPECIES: DUF6541 family protein [Pseudonocardia]|uniref:Uncharacterized protein n=2 Tax=Pseudonocardia TaxID=1847 RepID=A0A1Y2MJ26_PSEAH|nr:MULTISPECIES: DUF6541 family protein [Pseudonocardia]OSY35172.1 hypothetical protein BG845_06242 [Pseudonocardia autotrophica]TDN74983.1 hypothetical protein C8E95_4119 [Pseudonocardia autotrophica]BBF98922.1 hypothetical protein Pdca_01320 [Pseudonocardia autotrophica]GEC28644.1 hypothetical protein PSA01_56730 [Pseudonocardia saturnea]